MKSKNQKTTEQLIVEFISKGGVIKICQPKASPVRRKNLRPVITREMLMEAIRSGRAA